MLTSYTVVMPKQEGYVLQVLAERNFRGPMQQIRALIREEARRQGIVVAEEAVMESAEKVSTETPKQRRQRARTSV